MTLIRALLVFILFISVFTAQAQWTKTAFVDDFGEKTNEKIITQRFTNGTFENTYIKGGDMCGKVILNDQFIRFDLYLYCNGNSIDFWEGGKGRARNSTGEEITFNVDENLHTKSMLLYGMLKRSSGYVRISIRNSHRGKYNFKINANGFTKAFNSHFNLNVAAPEPRADAKLKAVKFAEPLMCKLKSGVKIYSEPREILKEEIKHNGIKLYAEALGTEGDYYNIKVMGWKYIDFKNRPIQFNCYVHKDFVSFPETELESESEPKLEPELESAKKACASHIMPFLKVARNYTDKTYRQVKDYWLLVYSEDEFKETENTFSIIDSERERTTSILYEAKFKDDICIETISIVSEEEQDLLEKQFMEEGWTKYDDFFFRKKGKRNQYRFLRANDRTQKLQVMRDDWNYDKVEAKDKKKKESVVEELTIDDEMIITKEGEYMEVKAYLYKSNTKHGITEIYLQRDNRKVMESHPLFLSIRTKKPRDYSRAVPHGFVTKWANGSIEEMGRNWTSGTFQQTALTSYGDSLMQEVGISKIRVGMYDAMKNEEFHDAELDSEYVKKITTKILAVELVGGTPEKLKDF